MIDSTLYRIGKQISKEIENKLDKIGLLYRIFFRAKNANSISEKIKFKNYSENGKKLQDSIGIRIAAYFHDDLTLIKSIIENSYALDNQTIDEPSETEFSPERMNCVFRLNGKLLEDFTVSHQNPAVDSTFEVQIRTVLSEGWHEVEHDLRYKCKDAWQNYFEESRILNGIWANLSNCDWAMNTLFQKMAYSNYKSMEWSSMIRNKFRIRINKSNLSEKLIDYMSNIDNNFSKNMLRVDRKEFLEKFYKSKILIPLTYDNVVFLVNYLVIKDSVIIKETPSAIKEMDALKV